MNIALRSLLLAVCCVAVAACQGNRVVTDYDPAVDFSTYQQYQWLEERSGASEEFDPLLAQRVRDALATELRARGFTEAENAAPDFRVRYYVASGAAVSEPGARGSVGMGSLGRNVGVGVSLGFPLGGTRVTRHADIIIDFIDPASGRLAWRGQQAISFSGDDPQAIAGEVQQAVSAIVAGFPPAK